jgi:phosphopantothenoylcysteine synthetase/decarboxylase
MRILVTAGNTQVPIDKVRCITNVFTGRTGTRIALEAHQRGHEVILVTSHPELVPILTKSGQAPTRGWNTRGYRTFEDLEKEMEEAIRSGALDAVIHCAAVSDYRSAGIYAPAPGTRFDETDGQWLASAEPRLTDKKADKVKSTEPELWVRLLPTPKLVDRIRSDWRFQGILVKFKLEVGIGEDQLLEIAEQSRNQSPADLMVANTLETRHQWAYVGPLDGRYQRIDRKQLPQRLLEAVERLYQGERSG